MQTQQLSNRQRLTIWIVLQPFFLLGLFSQLSGAESCGAGAEGILEADSIGLGSAVAGAGKTLARTCNSVLQLGHLSTVPEAWSAISIRVPQEGQTNTTAMRIDPSFLGATAWQLSARHPERTFPSGLAHRTGGIVLLAMEVVNNQKLPASFRFAYPWLTCCASALPLRLP
jgi:hypothetical protein